MKNILRYLIYLTFVFPGSSYAKDNLISSFKKLQKVCKKDPQKLSEALIDLEKNTLLESKKIEPKKYRDVIYGNSKTSQFFMLLAPYAHEPVFHDSSLTTCYTRYKKFFSQINIEKKRSERLMAWIYCYQAHFKNEPIPPLMATVKICVDKLNAEN